jgi:hypothetical protein
MNRQIGGELGVRLERGALTDGESPAILGLGQSNGGCLWVGVGVGVVGGGESDRERHHLGCL